MKFLALPILVAFASTSMAATLPADQAQKPIQQAQDSANGSMTNTNLTGQLDQDTSQLNGGTTSGTTQGAIVDQSSKRKKKAKKKHTTTQEQTATETESGSTSQGAHGNENLYAPTTTQGRSRNDEIGINANDTRASDEAGSREK